MVSTEEATVRRILSSFVPPARAEALAAAAAVAPGDPVVNTVARLREEYGAGDEDLVFALADAGVAGGQVAQLTGVERRTVNEWLDEGVAPLPPVVQEVQGEIEQEVPRSFDRARQVVRIVWIGLLVALVALYFQSRSGDDCEQELCIESVMVMLPDTSTVATTDRAVFDPADVEAVQFDYSSDSSWEGEVRWSAEGVELSVTPVSVQGSSTFVVGRPLGALPLGVHVVEIVDGPPEATIVFSVQR